jgi:hypothetical protein
MDCPRSRQDGPRSRQPRVGTFEVGQRYTFLITTEQSVLSTCVKSNSMSPLSNSSARRRMQSTKIAWGHTTLLGKSLYQMCNAMNNEMEVTSPDAVGVGRMEPSATFGRGQQHCISLLGPQPRSPPLPELATLAPTSPSLLGEVGTTNRSTNQDGWLQVYALCMSCCLSCT